ncbi:hypothetical protein ACOMHN_022516 [Nucella lapillus]
MPALVLSNAADSTPANSRLKRVEAKTQPCFTPFVTGKGSDTSPFSMTLSTEKQNKMSMKKGGQDWRQGRYGLAGASHVVSSMKRQQHARPWTLLQQSSMDQWKAGHAGATGFTETTMTCDGTVTKECNPTFCISRQGIFNVHKSGPIFSFRRKSKFTKMAEHFEYNHIPAHLSSIENFHMNSVLCSRGDIVVLHLVRNLMSQFGVVNLDTNKFMGIFGKKSVEFVNEALQGEISPDCGFCLIKTPSLRANNAFVLQLYNLHNRDLLTEITLPYDHAHFTFDPRFCGSRVAVTSFLQGQDNSLSLVRLPTWEVLATNSRVDGAHRSLNPRLKDLRYSRDGELIFVVMATSGCHCQEMRARRFQPIDISVLILSGTSAQRLHCLQYQRYACALHSCPTNYMPLMSVCGSRLAIMLIDMDTTTDFIQVYKLPVGGSLQNRCRSAILQTFAPEFIPRLLLPSRLINYLKFKPETF